MGQRWVTEEEYKQITSKKQFGGDVHMDDETFINQFQQGGQNQQSPDFGQLLNVAGMYGSYFNSQNQFNDLQNQTRQRGMTDSLYAGSMNPAGIKGDYSNTGSNYGSFRPSQQSFSNPGAFYPQFQQGGNIPTQADSIALYNNAKQVQDYYNSKNYSLFRDHFDKNGYGDFNDNNKHAEEELKERGYWVVTPQGVRPILPQEYKQNLNTNQYKQRELEVAKLDTDAPMQLFDKRIKPTKAQAFSKLNGKLEGDIVDINSYDPIAVKPWNMLTPSERQERIKKYGYPTNQQFSLPHSKIPKITPVGISSNTVPQEMSTIPVPQLADTPRQYGYLPVYGQGQLGTLQGKQYGNGEFQKYQIGGQIQMPVVPVSNVSQYAPQSSQGFVPQENNMSDAPAKLPRKGDISTTTNNPGNMKYHPWMASLGAQPSGIPGQDGGVFAAFPNVQTGLKAYEMQLFGDTDGVFKSNYYKPNTPVDKALKTWSNNGYGAEIYPQIQGKTLAELTPQERDELMKRQIKRESPKMYSQLKAQNYFQEGGIVDMTPSQLKKFMAEGGIVDFV